MTLGGPTGAALLPAAPLDRTARVLTLGVTAALLLVALEALFGGGVSLAQGAGVALLGLALLGAAAAFAPVGYRWDGDALLVERRWTRAKRYPGVQEVGPAPRAFGLGGLRIGGSGGLFGWYGGLWRSGLGACRAHVTDRDSVVGVRTAAGLVLVSPADPEAFRRTAPR